MSGDVARDRDHRFSLPAVDDHPATEAGVILMGLDAERLLAGLGLASLAEDTALVTLMADRARHDAVGRLTSAQFIALGARRWRSAREALGPVRMTAGRSAGSPRLVWASAARSIEALPAVRGMGAASLAYLTACWIRHDDVDALAAHVSASAGG